MDFLSSDSGASQEKIFSILFNEDELTWQNIIYDLVKSEGMDPWDIDISMLSQKFLDMLKKLREMDFRISGKVVLACAILLKLKSNKLVDEDILALDNLMSSVDDPGELLEELPEDSGRREREPIKGLMPRTPQPRKRKVSVYDLIDALEKALEVESRRPIYVEPKVKIRMPENMVDMGELIQETYQKVESFYQGKQPKECKRLTFTELIPSDSKEDKVFTFIPLLHLENQRKVDMYQEIHFGEIEIDLLKHGVIELLPPESKEDLKTAE